MTLIPAKKKYKRHINTILREAAEGIRTPELMEELKSAYLVGFRGDKKKIINRLQVIGFSEAEIEQIRKSKYITTEDKKEP
jgi:hypothetical protein